MNTILILNAKIVNENKIEKADLLVKGDKIEKIGSDLSSLTADRIINAEGQYLLPGLIDDQVHFREPGLTHKATIYTESKAAVAGGITSFMEMPNTVPQATTQELLEDKYQIAAKDSLANYSFYMGATNDNIEEVLKTDKRKVCGVKAFMGSSTGNMLVDNEETLNNLFSKVKMLIATHCEDEATVRANTEEYKEKYGENIPFSAHPEIRSREACLKSSSLAVRLAKKYNTRLHILHISTADEIALFENKTPLTEKRITAEACVHHLWFSDKDYETKGAFIKWNPAVKSAQDREAILKAVIDGHIDVIATDHAPHTLEEKENKYLKAPSGGPLAQHCLPALLDMHKDGKITLEKIVEKAAHNPAILFQVEKRGFIKEGYFADLVLVDLNSPWIVKKDNIFSKCSWSPFENHKFSASITHTVVSGHLAYEKGQFNESQKGKRLNFDR